jgi:hypothetical protein
MQLAIQSTPKNCQEGGFSRVPSLCYINGVRTPRLSGYGPGRRLKSFSVSSIQIAVRVLEEQRGHFAAITTDQFNIIQGIKRR